MKGLIVLDLSSNQKYSRDRNKKTNHCTGNRTCSVTGIVDRSIDDMTGGDLKTKTHHNEKNSLQTKHLSYPQIVDLLIKGQKFRYQYPNADICCRVESCPLTEDLMIKQILGTIYDRVIVTETWDRKEIQKIKDEKHYDVVKKLDASYIGLDDSQFDTDYEYYQLKQLIGPVHHNHFMFKERDVEMQQRGGFNFNKKRIKYPTKESDPKLNTVCEMYRIDCKNIHHYHLKYYHTNKNIQYRPFNLKPMFDDVGEYEYEVPLQKLRDYHSENSYYSRLLQRNENLLDDAHTSERRLNLVDQINVGDRDSIMFQYLRCRPKTFVITLWRPAIEGLDKLVELLEKSGNVYYIKTITLSKQGLRNLLFWYYDDFTYAERLVFIEKKMEYINVTDDNNPICYILFDNVNNKQLSGQGSVFKHELRNKIMEFLGVDKSQYRGNDLMHVNDYFYQTVEYSQLLLNKNSIDMLNKQDCRIIPTDDFTIANLKMQTLRKVVYSNMSQLEMDRMLTMGGTVFYSYGIRAFNDVDAILIGIEPNSSARLTQVIENMFSNKKSKFYFLDAGIQGSDDWNESWTKKDQKILDFLNIESFKDLVLDPANFFYYQGMKIVSLEYEMIRKLMRNRTEDHVDFMMLNLLVPQIVNKYVKLTELYASDGKNSLNDYTELHKNNSESSVGQESSDYQENDNAFFKINKKFANIVGKFDDRFPDSKMKILRRRYSKEQINSVKSLDAFKDFFNT